MVCENCRNPDGSPREVARAQSNDPQVLGLLLLAVHATPEHSAFHKLQALIDGQPAETVPAPGEKRYHLVIQCASCNKTNDYGQVPASTITACAIAHHSNHEGHSMVVSLDGVQYHPPGGQS